MPGSKIFRQTLNPSARLLVVAALIALAACHKSENSGSDSMGWNGMALSPQQEVLNPSDTLLQNEGFPETVQPLPKRAFEISPNGISAIKLLEFNDDEEAYAAFQRMGDASELAAGFAVRGEKTFFRNGKWIGLLADSNNGLDELQSKLALPGKELWGTLPQIFSSLIQQGRLSCSERVLTGRFFGVSVSTPVFAAQFDCHGDSAWIYASPGMPLNLFNGIAKKNGYHLDSTKAGRIIMSDSGSMEPVRLNFSSSGMVGVEGCFDTSLVFSWIKTQKKALRSLKLEP